MINFPWKVLIPSLFVYLPANPTINTKVYQFSDIRGSKGPDDDLYRITVSAEVR